MLPFVIQETVKSRAFGSDPERTVRRRADRQRYTALPVVWRIERFNFSRAQGDETVTAGARPQRPLPILAQAADPVAGKTIRMVEMQDGAAGRQQINTVVGCSNCQQTR